MFGGCLLKHSRARTLAKQVTLPPLSRNSMSWHARLVRLGRLRTTLYLTAFSVGASVALVAVFFVLFKAQPEDARAYFIPAVIVPAVVAPSVIHVLLSMALALDDAHTKAAQQQEQLQGIRQMDLIGRLASGLAHDFNNLLTVVRANVEALGGTAANAELASIDDAALRGSRLTQRLLSVSRHVHVVLVPQPLAPLLHETEEMLRRVLPVGVPLELPAQIPTTVLHLDRDSVQQALLNLVLNARDAVSDHGRLALGVYERSRSSTPWIVIEVRDDGPGMSPEVLGQATEPFYTTKPAHQGTGLGLAIVQRTMEQHGDRLVIESAPGQGTTAELWFPTTLTEIPAAARDATRQPPKPAPRAPQAAPHDGPYRLLVVDDDPQVRRVTERALQRLGHHVVSVSDIAAAKSHLESDAGGQVIISDVMMPGGTGFDLVRDLRRNGNYMPVLLVSGFTLDALAEDLEADARVALVAKPWDLPTLVAGIEQVRSSLPCA